MKLKIYKNSQDTNRVAAFWCPGCQCEHPFRIKSHLPDLEVWEWNQDMEKPTFSPSLLCYPNTAHGRCHCFVRDGRIEFCSDCDHALAGQTVDLPDLPED